MSLDLKICLFVNKCRPARFTVKQGIKTDRKIGSFLIKDNHILYADWAYDTTNTAQETTDVLGKVLYTASLQMKNAYSRSDDWFKENIQFIIIIFYHGNYN